MKSDFLIAVTQLAAERNLPREVVISAIEAALISVYKKDSMVSGQDLSVKILPSTGEVKVSSLKTVVEKVEDPELQITLKEATKYKKDASLDDIIEIEVTPQFAGRIAAQTAKQVVMQRLREAERELVYEEFHDKEGDIVSAVVERIEPKQIVMDVEKTEAVMLVSEMVPAERYRVGQRLKVLVQEVNNSAKGPQVIVSRAHRHLVTRLFELEVPEVYNGTVEIRSIARESGYRTKVAVSAKQEGIDPVGSCVGLRGIRIQNIVNELHGEKIDVVQWDKDPAVFIANALSPAQVARVGLNDEGESASSVVADRHLSLAIGKEGQNARLAAKLTSWHIDIKGASEAEAERLTTVAAVAEAPPEDEATDESAVVEPAVAVEEAPVEAATEEAPVQATTEEVAAPVAEELAPVAEELVTGEVAPIEEEPASEEAPAETLAVEEVFPTVEERSVPEEVPVASVADERTAPRSIEEIWPSAGQLVKPGQRIRFAEDLNISLPGRSRSKSNKSNKSKKKKGKRAGSGDGTARGAVGKKARTAIPGSSGSYGVEETDKVSG
jgi:N utilization substance protein A